MLIPQPKDILHKAWLYRLLSELADDRNLLHVFRFKGGTCAAMLGYLDRFSVDLDFDYIGEKKNISDVRNVLEKHFTNLDLVIKNYSKIGLQYFLKYPSEGGKRNTIKFDAAFPSPMCNVYEPKYFTDIDRTMQCQTIETMFANKFVAILDRYERHSSLAGRDIYDIHHFFLKGFRYRAEVIEERRATSVENFFMELLEFVEQKFTQRILQEDISTLIPYQEFQKARKILKQETLMFLRDELQRVKSVSKN